MTVYAIVNGLAADLTTDENEAPIWSILSPSGILQGGNPYFVPDFSDCFEARIALAIRIGRLGKGIARRFASRYVESVAPAVLFVASDLLASLQGKGLPWTQAISYDRCLALGRPSRIPFENIPDIRVGLRVLDRTDQLVAESSEAFPDLDIGPIIERLSRDNTLKTGDIILLEIAKAGPKATPGLSARLTLNGEEALKFNIR